MYYGNFIYLLFYISVRSLSSIALRKSLNSRPGFHFNYFTVDLNEELSGLNGALLYDQITYVNQSIQRVLELYQNRYNPPKSVVLVGHSMVSTIIAYILLLGVLESNLVFACTHVQLTLNDLHRKSFCST